MPLTPETVVETIVKALVASPDKVAIRQIRGMRTDILEVSVAPGELGPVIGRQGRMAQAIRHVADSIAHRYGRSVRVDFVDPNGRSANR